MLLVRLFLYAEPPERQLTVKKKAILKKVVLIMKMMVIMPHLRSCPGE